MATTTFFEKLLEDQGGSGRKIEFQFGRSSFTGENLIYFSINDEWIIVDQKTGTEICEAMSRLASYLGYDK
jgi:hypothetical protein